MKISYEELLVEKWIVRENVLKTIQTSTLSFLTLPAFNAYEVMITGKPLDAFAILTFVSIIALRAFVAGLLSKTSYRLQLARSRCEKSQQAPPVIAASIVNSNDTAPGGNANGDRNNATT